MNKTIYAADKPSDCRYCYFWTSDKKGCHLGEANCYYRLEQKPKRKANNECNGCPYGVHSPCIGWCTKNLMKELHRGKA